MQFVHILVNSAALAVASSSFASIVAGWDFSDIVGGTGNFGPAVLAASASDANSTVGGLTRGSGVTTPAGQNAAPHAWGGAGWNSTSRAQAEANQDFISFSVVAKAGYSLSIASIGRYNVRHSAAGPIMGQWQFQVDGNGWNDIGSAITWGTTNTAAGNEQASIDLSGISALQNVASGSTIAFRVLNWSASTANGTWYLNDPGSSTGTPLDFTVDGTVSPHGVPAPGGIALLGAIGLVGSARRRRH